MAQPPLMTLSDVSLSLGSEPLFADLSLAVQPGDRTALVGRNGTGKSTLMRLIAGLVEPDQGKRFVKPGVSIAYMEQDPDLSGFATLGDYALSALDASEAYRVDMALEGLKLEGAREPDAASGGERRRAALARTLAEDPDILLLDEPTNHLDIEAILWLEETLKATRKAFILISHDRRFLSELTERTLWIDRGVARRLEQGFSKFEDWRDKHFEEEDLARHKLDRLIKSESRWAVEGISARRKRNMGRVRRLKEMRADRAAQIRRTGPARLELGEGTKSGKLVIEASHVSKTFDVPIIKDFSLRIQRGDRVALFGPNGVGKTTLLNILIGREAPDEGRVRLGTGLELAVFDQTRATLDPDKTLWASLTEDSAIGVKGRSDQVMVRGQPRHVIGYLKDFLFSESQARAPVRALSGGEKARLLLARIMARESNLLVLDEPTNDLDIETLDLLQEVLDDYEGTVLLVSHDRDFLDRVAGTTIALEGQGRAVVYAGGYSDMLAQRKDDGQAKPDPTPAAKPRKAVRPAANPAGRLTNKQSDRLAKLPDEIDRLSAEIAKLEAFLSDPELFSQAPDKFEKASAGLVERQEKLVAAEEEWLELEELNGG